VGPLALPRDRVRGSSSAFFAPVVEFVGCHRGEGVRRPPCPRRVLELSETGQLTKLAMIKSSATATRAVKMAA
jgi:hypothetical protein